MALRQAPLGVEPHVAEDRGGVNAQERGRFYLPVGATVEPSARVGRAAPTCKPAGQWRARLPPVYAGGEWVPRELRETLSPVTPPEVGPLVRPLYLCTERADWRFDGGGGNTYTLEAGSQAE